MHEKKNEKINGQKKISFPFPKLGTIDPNVTPDSVGVRPAAVRLGVRPAGRIAAIIVNYTSRVVPSPLIMSTWDQLRCVCLEWHSSLPVKMCH